MAYLEIENQDGVALVKLNNGVINALNLSLLGELDQGLQHVRDDPERVALVITSSNDKFFCIGFALPELYPLPPAEFATFFRAFNRLCLQLFTFPKPTIAALTGHAAAGGCILALCTDYRLAAIGIGRMGLNEIMLSVPVTRLACCILKDLLGDRRTRDALYSGKLYTFHEAFEMGMVDEILPPDEVVPTAVLKARELGALSQEAFTANKHLRTHAIEAQVLAHVEEEERQFVQQWYSAEARQRLQAALEKFLPRK